MNGPFQKASPNVQPTKSLDKWTSTADDRVISLGLHKSEVTVSTESLKVKTKPGKRPRDVFAVFAFPVSAIVLEFQIRLTSLSSLCLVRAASRDRKCHLNV